MRAATTSEVSRSSASRPALSLVPGLATYDAAVAPHTGFEDLRLDTDPVTLREIVADRQPLTAILDAVEEALDESADEDRAERSRLHGQQCVLLRLLGDLDGALVAGRLSLRYSGDDSALVTVAGVRLAHVHQWRGEYQVADGIYTQALEGAPDGYRSFACLHAGKSRYEQGDADAAIRHFENAVRLRTSGPADLLAAAEQALDAARRLKTDMDLSGL